jgi:hypothetical protein
MKGKVKNMKKVDLYPNNEAVFAVPPEPIDENEPICLLDYLIPESKETNRYYEKVRRFGEDTFVKKIGGTTYEVSTHFKPDGRQSALEQFKQLILAERLI